MWPVGVNWTVELQASEKQAGLEGGSAGKGRERIRPGRKKRTGFTLTFPQPRGVYLWRPTNCNSNHLQGLNQVNKLLNMFLPVVDKYIS